MEVIGPLPPLQHPGGDQTEDHTRRKPPGGVKGMQVEGQNGVIQNPNPGRCPPLLITYLVRPSLCFSCRLSKVTVTSGLGGPSPARLTAIT